MLTAKSCHVTLLYLPTSFRSGSEQCFCKRDFDKDRVQRQRDQYDCRLRKLAMWGMADGIRHSKSSREKTWMSSVKRYWTGSQVENIRNLFCVILKGRRRIHKIYQGTNFSINLNIFTIVVSQQQNRLPPLRSQSSGDAGGPPIKSSAGKIETPDWVTSTLLLCFCSLLIIFTWICTVAGELTSATPNRLI